MVNVSWPKIIPSLLAFAPQGVALRGYLPQAESRKEPRLRPILTTILTLTMLAPVAAGALPSSAPKGDVEERLDLLLEPPGAGTSKKGERAGAGDGVDIERLKEHLIGLVPGEALESIARRLVDRQLQVQVSSKKTIFVFSMELD